MPGESLPSLNRTWQHSLDCTFEQTKKLLEQSPLHIGHHNRDLRLVKTKCNISAQTPHTHLAFDVIFITVTCLWIGTHFNVSELEILWPNNHCLYFLWL